MSDRSCRLPKYLPIARTSSKSLPWRWQERSLPASLELRGTATPWHRPDEEGRAHRAANPVSAQSIRFHGTGFDVAAGRVTCIKVSVPAGRRVGPSIGREGKPFRTGIAPMALTCSRPGERNYEPL